MIEVLRLGHRIKRDERLSTHVALTSRAFLVDKLYYSGQKDEGFEESVEKVNKEFGSKFEIEYVENPLKLVKSKKNIIHLTAYGLKLREEIKKIKKFKDLLIIVGGAKVEPEYFKLADFNISVTNQPISEVSSLSVFLHEYLDGKELENVFKDGKKRIVPCEKGKIVKN